MSGYTTAMMGVVDLMSGASADAAYESAYGKFYSASQGMLNAANKRSAAEANMAAIRQDRIQTDKVIAMKQDQAEAQAKVMAAVSGTEGQSVESTIYQTEVNASIASQNNKKEAKQMMEDQLAAVYESTSTMLSLDNPQVEDISMGMALAEGAVSFLGTDSLRQGAVESIESMFEKTDEYGFSSTEDPFAEGY